MRRVRGGPGRRAVTCAAVWVLLAGVEAAAQSEVAIAPSVSHVNQKLPELLTLAAEAAEGEFTTCSNEPAIVRAVLRRVFPDGARLLFGIPPGRFLVVTDVALHAAVLFNEQGEETRAVLKVRNPATGAQNDVLFFGVTRTGNGVAVENVHLSTGFTVGPGMHVCVDVENGEPLHVILNGYLLKFP